MLKGYNFQQEKGKKNGQSYHAWLQRRYVSGHHQNGKGYGRSYHCCRCIDLKNDKENGYPAYPSLEECKEEADVVVDFASPKAADHLMDFCAEKKLGPRSCTTGLSEAQIIKKVGETAENSYNAGSANMSLGVNPLLKLVQDVAKYRSAGFDIEI